METTAARGFTAPLGSLGFMRATFVGQASWPVSLASDSARPRSIEKSRDRPGGLSHVPSSPHLHAAGVSLQAFGTRERGDRGSQRGQRGARQLLHRNHFQVIVHAQAAALAGAPPVGST